eukprot:Plantae.Rhodophyta-Rhodochaete_pulchella.ctg30346.p1 GENE.Plantae.Rhodophyta-Rhodochaete_pulchella.ctg30346~~Plantae.Rhodophyta-Rhodochaete_pulchella.ctg30346.p1  ORF type:complete len:249 (-),score=54.13 Plantae.Rhodophyta-Rhodochaete_pulchella.ctg30346:456-1118(-)
MQGYAYILTHPGLPCVFYDHIFDWKLKDPIQELISVRKTLGINASSKVIVKIERADNTGYIARVQATEDTPKQLYVKLGHVMWSPSEARGWKIATSGHGYAVWVREGIPRAQPEPGLKRVLSQEKPFLPIPAEDEVADELQAVEVSDKSKVAAPQKKLTKPVLNLVDQALKFVVKDGSTKGKKVLVMEYEVDAVELEDAEFTVTLQGKRDDVDSMVTRSL